MRTPAALHPCAGKLTRVSPPTDVHEEESKRRAGPKSGSNALAKRDRSAKGKRSDRQDGSLEALDAALMSKLAENIGSMKHDFIMVHLWYECSRCRKTIENANRYHSVGDSTPHFELCEECYGIEQSLPVEERLYKHELKAEAVPALPETKDTDDQIECEFFDTRQAFLSMCTGNKFQFDTLRRANRAPSPLAGIGERLAAMGAEPAGGGRGGGKEGGGAHLCPVWTISPGKVAIAT